MKRDVVVIGSGFGGLSAAILLTRLGRTVTLVEGGSHPGGALRSYRRERVDCPVGVHYFGSAAPGELLGDFIDLLGIRYALKLRRLGGNGIIDRFVFEDDVFDLPDTPEKFAATLARRFPETPDAVAFVMQVCHSAMASLRTDRMSKAPLALPMTRTALDLLTEKGLPERMVDLLALQGFLLGVDLSACPAAFLLIATASLLMSAWELGCTGIEMANALAETAVCEGVELILGDAVSAIEVSQGRASGVRLESGARVDAGVVIAGIHPKTVLDLIPEGALPESYRSGIGKMQETTGMLCAVALLDETLHPAQDFNLYRIRGTPRRDLEGVYGQIRPSGLPGFTRLVAATASRYDDWSRWHDTRTGRRGLDYRAEKLRRAEHMLTDLELATGPLRARIIDVWTPLSMRDWLGAPRGCSYGVKHSTRDGLDFLVLSRPPLDGLFLVGQNAMAPGLLGVSMGVLRVASAVTGRPGLGELMATLRSSSRVTG